MQHGIFILVRCEIDFVFGRYRRKLELFLSIQMSYQIIILCFIYLHTNLKLKNFRIFVKMQDYIFVLYDPQLFVCWWNYNIVFSIFVQQMLSKYHVILYPWKVTARTQTHKIIVLFQHFRIYKNSLRHWTELLFKV